MLTLYIADVERDVGMKNLSQEEAEKVLEGMKVKIEIPKAAVTQWKRNAALDMAIEALKCSEVPNSSDCISRQAVINLIRGCNSALEEPRIFDSHNSGTIFKHYITELPSVNPQPKTGCEGCIYEKTGNNSTYPCSHCGRCYTDKYKAESEE